MTDKTLKKVVDLCYEMLELADYGDQIRREAGAGVVYGTLRDAAYKIRRMAEKEIKKIGGVPKKGKQAGDNSLETINSADKEEGL